MENFTADKAVLDEAITQRLDGTTLYLYRKETHEDECTIETALKNLVGRKDI